MQDTLCLHLLKLLIKTGTFSFLYSSLGIKIAGVLLGGASVDPELQNNHYDSFLFSTGIVTPNGRDVAHSMEN